jgi:SAM-dependent methyltransferase
VETQGDGVTRPGLDHDFLRYIGCDSKTKKAHQRFYLPFFEGCGRVVDLGCGSGDFVELLLQHDVDAVGVDPDPVAAQSMRERGLPVVQQDALAYLDTLAPESIDGVFAAHLVEHLPYERVYALVEGAYRALRSGGTIVLATPDPRSLVAHLEMYYLHFGHETFYHPRLLCFFLERVGFVGSEFGSSDSPVQPQSPMFDLTGMHPIRPTLPVWRQGLFWRFVRAVRMAVAYVFLNPYLDLIQSNFQRLAGALARVDRPFECYVKASKPVPESGGIAEKGHT